jgi:alpha-beta hydrolase superfamily lysophospholipase
MNRAHTVWLDQLGSTSSTALPSSAGAVALPIFSLEMAGLEAPRTKREGLMRLLHFVWTNKGRIAVLIALWTAIKKLHALSRSQQDAPVIPLSSQFPSFIPSASTSIWLYTRAWRVPPSVERGRVFIVHAHREHVGRYEGLAQRLNAAGYSVFGLDHQGHGQSGGARGYVESFRHYIQDYMEFMSLTMVREGVGSGGGADTPVFLLGHSMGATIALQIARIHEWRRAAEAEDRDREAESEGAKKHAPPDAIVEEEAWEEDDQHGSSSTAAAASATPNWRIHGLILSCPALIPDQASVSPLLQALASSLADIVPRFGFSTVLNLSALSGEPATIAQFNRDPLVYRGVMNARFGHEMMEAMADTRQGLREVMLPILVCQGRRDQIVSPAGAQFVIDHAASTDKTVKFYEAGTHDLYLDTVREQFAQDVIEWLQRQTNVISTSSVTASRANRRR